jgi:hypothetical protein
MLLDSRQVGTLELAVVFLVIYTGAFVVCVCACIDTCRPTRPAAIAHHPPPRVDLALLAVALGRGLPQSNEWFGSQ